MTWKAKALVMAACGALPAGDRIYAGLQRRFGNLTVRPYPRLATQVEIAQWLQSDGKTVEGKTFFEVGTGHVPWVPFALYLCGAERIFTFDLNRRLDFGVLSGALKWLTDNRDEVTELYRNIADPDGLRKRLNVVAELWPDPVTALERANIQYFAPEDAARSGLPPGTVDVHYSLTTFEHIPRQVILNILKEARRVLKPTGLALHFIDLSDHFQHQDASIAQVNFLRYSEPVWKLIAGNEFAYSNRLRKSDYEELFQNAGFDVVRRECIVDSASLAVVQNGFPVDPAFSSYGFEDLCTTRFRCMARPSAPEASPELP